MNKNLLFNKKMHFFYFTLLMLIFSNLSWGQSDPAAFDLSGGNFSFTSQTATSTSFPTNIQGWSTSANNIVGAETTAPGINHALIASGGTSTSGISNIGANGFQFLSVSTTNSVNRLVGSICVAVNTTGRQDVKATWTAADQSTGTTALRIMALTLQYRIGTSGTFTTVANSTYKSAASSAATAQTFSNVALPVECWNRAIVQLRWIYYETPSQAGSRDPIRLDEITVSSSSGFSCPTFASTITVNPTSTPVVGSVYNKLSDVVGYLNNCSINQPIVIELSTNYVGTGESFPITLRAVSGMSSTNTITIRPATGATVNLSANVLSNPIFSINGGTYWNIDGRAGGAGTTKSLTIENISTATLSPGILLINGAQYNTITYCNIKSASTSTTLAGTVAFSTSTASVGNSFNTVSYCNISDASTGTSTSSITSSPTGTSLADARFNNNNTITYNNIYNFYNATSTSYLGAGIVLTNGYNSDWTISNNSFYQTSTRNAGGTGAEFYCIYVNGIEGGNFTISNNYIGGIEPNCGSTPMTFITSATNSFRGIYFSSGSASASTISNNVIKNISFSTATTSSVNAGISVLNGAATISYNTIGALDVDASSSPSINFVSGGSGSANFNGILAGTGTISQEGITISNNSIGGIKCSRTGGGPIAFSGIRIESGTGATITAAQYSVTSNTIGSTTTSNSLYNTSNNNIHGIYNLTTNTVLANSITDNTITNLASNTTAMITATATVGTGGTATVNTYTVTSGNTLSAACGSGSSFVVSGAGFPTGSYISAYTSTTAYTITYPTQGSAPALAGIFTVTETPINQVIGFRNSGSSSACTFSNNTISNLSCNLSNPFANSGGTFSVIGIYSTATAGGLFSGNTIHSLSGTNSTAAQAVAGIYTTGQNSGTTSIIEKNNIHSLFLATNSTSGSLFGIYENAYPLITKNNIIRLGTKNDGTSITTGYQISGIYDAVTLGATSNYFNSVYIGGSSVVGSASNTYALQSAGSTNARDYRNNILFNARSNSSSSTGKNYAYRITGLTNLTSDNNDYFANGTDGVLGYFGSDKTSLSGWQTATSTDANSISSDPNFTSSTNLLPTTGENLIGTSISGITTDYTNSNRVGIPSMGAYEVSIPNCWTGTTDTVYNTTTNWDDATVPSSGDSVVIPSSVTNSPVLDADRTIGTLNIGTNKTLTINGKILTINGAVTGSGTLTGSASSSLVIGGTAGTLKFTNGSRTLKDVTLANNATATLGTALDITAGITSGSVTVGTGATLATGNLLTLKSDANGTARVGNSAGTISGNVTVERYIPARRAWRALTAPVSTASSIFTNWQEGGNGNGTNGIEIWAPSGGTGLTTGGSSNSLLSYNSTGNSWTGIAATNGASSMMIGDKNKPFMAFVTGPYGSTNITNNLAAETTLRATGSLISGTQSYESASGEYTFIGNPYASPLDISLMLDDTENSVFGTNIWVWDAKAAGTYSVGAYNTFDNTNDSYTNITNPAVPGDTTLAAGTLVQSGQAFFVKQSSGSSANFKIKEGHKGSTFSNAVFRQAAVTETLRVGLYKRVNNEWIGKDGAMTVLFAEANANQLPNKMANGSENIAFTKNGLLFASEHHLPLVASDVLNVKVWNTTAGVNYKLKINTEQFTTTNLDATLEDLFTNSRTPLILNGTAVEYPFAVTTEAASTGNRFRIVFQNAVLGINNPKATEISILPNPITGDTFQVNLGTLSTGTYSYSICNTLGQEVEKGNINNVSQNTNYTVKFKNNTATGMYIMKVTGTDNTVFNLKIIKK